MTLSGAANTEFDTVVVRVKPGDTLGGILRQYYGSITASQQQELIRQAQTINPQVKNPNLLHPDQLLKLHIPIRFCAAPAGFPFDSNGFPGEQAWFTQLDSNWKAYSKAERDGFTGLSHLLLGSGTAQLSMIDRTFKTNSPLLDDMVSNYQAYKNGDITKGQYDYRRLKLVNEFSHKLGPTNLLLNGRSQPNEVLRISRAKAISPTESIERQISKMHKLSTAASRGGVALSVVGLGIACNQIANADNQQVKNEIFVESVGGLTGGAAFVLGAAVSLLFVATPVGWVAALAIAAGGAVTSYATGSYARKLYDRHGKEIDFVGMARVDTICSNTPTAGARPLISSNMLSAM